jgi:hypothetical protein
MYENGRLSSSERNEYIKKKTKKSLSLRMIQRYLPKLEKEGVLGHLSNEYFILHKGLYFAQDFGSAILNVIMETHYPTLYVFEDNLRRLIELFGVYMIYCFIEASRPLGEEMVLKSAADSDRLSDFWAKEMVDVDGMYRSFLTALQNQPDDNKDVKRNLKSLETDQKKGLVDYYGKKIFWPPTTADFSRELFIKIPYSLDDYPARPLYSLDHNKINKITKILQKRYSLFYDKFEDVRKRYGKENILRINNTKYGC